MTCECLPIYKIFIQRLKRLKRLRPQFQNGFHNSPTRAFMDLMFAIEMSIIILRRSRELIVDNLASPGIKLETLKMKMKSSCNKYYGDF